MINYVNTTFGGQLAVVMMIASGALERHPNLKVLVSEGGATWAPFLGDRMNEAHRQHWMFNQDEVSMPPKEYINRQVYASFQHDETAIPAMTAMGFTNVMFGTDYPHLEGVFPNTQKVLHELFEGVDDKVRDRITIERVPRPVPPRGPPAGSAGRELRPRTYGWSTTSLQGETTCRSKTRPRSSASARRRTTAGGSRCRRRRRRWPARRSCSRSTTPVSPSRISTASRSTRSRAIPRCSVRSSGCPRSASPPRSPRVVEARPVRSVSRRLRSHGGMAEVCVSLMTLQQVTRRLGGTSTSDGEGGGGGGGNPYGAGGVAPSMAFTANSGLISPGHSFSVITQRHMHQYGTRASTSRRSRSRSATTRCAGRRPRSRRSRSRSTTTSTRA